MGAIIETTAPTPEETHTLAVIALWVSRDVRRGDALAINAGLGVLSTYARHLERRYGQDPLKTWERAACVGERLDGAMAILDDADAQARRL